MEQGSPTVKKGDKVNPGDYIGNVGDSGNSKGAHLHVEVREGPDHLWGNSNNPNANPANYIPGLSK